jgi:hypothetical protein
MIIPKLNKWDAVRIEWSDPQGLPGEWQKVTKADTVVAGCVTVGQVYKVHADRLTVVCSWDDHNKNAHGGITILFCLISRLEKLT